MKSQRMHPLLCENLTYRRSLALRLAFHGRIRRGMPHLKEIIMDICPEFFSKYPGWTQPALAGTSGLSCASPPTHTNRGFWRETRQAEPSRKEAIDESFQKCASWLPAPVPPPLVLSVGSKVPRQAGALPGALVEPQASPRAGNDPSSK